MAFPTSNLQLSTVLQAYTGITAGTMDSLRGVTYYDSSGITYNAPAIGVLFPLLQTFGGKYSLSPAPFLQNITSDVSKLLPPAGRPIPTRFTTTMTGGSGGGGGGGSGVFSGGGDGSTTPGSIGGVAGTVNTGGGGGGGWNAGQGQPGGSGIVIIRYPI